MDHPGIWTSRARPHALSVQMEALQLFGEPRTHLVAFVLPSLHAPRRPTD